MPHKIEKDKRYYLEEELLLIDNSGEIPEIAYHGSLYFLCEDPEGPHLTLTDEELLPLKRAVFDRYRRILMRDVNPKLRDKRIYRGLLRCIANWDRFCKFCQKEGFDSAETREELKKALQLFLCREFQDIREKGQEPSINCTAEALAVFMETLGLAQDSLPQGWQEHCPPAS